MMEWERFIDLEDCGEKRKYAEMSGNIEVYRIGRALVLQLPDDGYRVLSNGSYGGGFTDSPKAVINLGSFGGKLEWNMMGDREAVYECNRAAVSKMGYNLKEVVMECTAANMENASVGTTECNGVGISVAITAGIRGNGGCAGDPAKFDEAERYLETNGTIVILLSVDAELSDTSMLRIMNMMTQAKSAVIQEMQAKSLYSHRLATGSGTDQIAVISHRNGVILEEFEQDSALSASIVGLVRENLYRAFDWQSYMTPSEQCDAMVQLSRFGIDEQLMETEIRFPNRMKDLMDAKPVVFRDPYVVALFTAVSRLQDAVDEGIMTESAALPAAIRILKGGLAHLMPATALFDERLMTSDSIPELMSLALAMMLQFRATRIQEGRA